MVKYLAILLYVVLDVAAKVPQRKPMYPLLNNKQKNPYLIPEIKIKFRLETIAHDVSII